MKKIIFIVVFLCGTSCFSQTKALYNQSVEAYKNNDFPLFLKLTKQLDSIRPSHPTYTYNLAAAYAVNKMETEAIAQLREVILMNNAIAFESDPDFDYLKSVGGYQELLQLKESQNTEVANSRFQFSLSEKDLHAEGLLYLGKNKIWLAGSIRHKKIVAFDNTGKCTDWFTDTAYSVFSIKADANEKCLWVTTSAMSVMEGYSKEMDGKNQILKIDIATKKIIKKYTIDGIHVLGDVIIANNGDVYISDSVAPNIYKIVNDEVVLWKDLKGVALNLQGLVFNSDQSKLFVADYLKGILMIDMKTQNQSWLQFPDGASKKGIDGLVFHKNALIGIHNGAKPIRIVKYQLNPANDQISSFIVLDNNRPEFNEPALSTISKGKLYFFANSPWNFYDEHNHLDTSKFESPKLFALDLDKK